MEGGETVVGGYCMRGESVFSYKTSVISRRKSEPQYIHIFKNNR